MNRFLSLANRINRKPKQDFCFRMRIPKQKRIESLRCSYFIQVQNCTLLRIRVYHIRQQLSSLGKRESSSFGIFCPALPKSFSMTYIVYLIRTKGKRSKKQSRLRKTNPQTAFAGRMSISSSCWCCSRSCCRSWSPSCCRSHRTGRTERSE